MYIYIYIRKWIESYINMQEERQINTQIGKRKADRQIKKHHKNVLLVCKNRQQSFFKGTQNPRKKKIRHKYIFSQLCELLVNCNLYAKNCVRQENIYLAFFLSIIQQDGLCMAYKMMSVCCSIYTFCGFSSRCYRVSGIFFSILKTFGYFTSSRGQQKVVSHRRNVQT